MKRTTLLLALSSLVAAQEVPAVHEMDAFLAPGQEEKVVVREMREPAREVHLLLEFRFGLYRISKKGKIQAAAAGIRLEYNEAARAEGIDNPYRPLPVQADLNPAWTDVCAGEQQPAGEWYTHASSTTAVDRRIILRFEADGRYRLRVTGLLEDTAAVRRTPTLVGLVEVREEEGEVPVEIEELPEIEGPEVKEVEEPEVIILDEPDEPEVVAVEREVVVHVPVFVPTLCPFCSSPLTGIHVRIGGSRHYHCRHCTGAVHVYRDGTRRCSIQRYGHRGYYDLRHGSAVGYRHDDHGHRAHAGSRAGRGTRTVHTPRARRDRAPPATRAGTGTRTPVRSRSGARRTRRPRAPATSTRTRTPTPPATRTPTRTPVRTRTSSRASRPWTRSQQRASRVRTPARTPPATRTRTPVRTRKSSRASRRWTPSWQRATRARTPARTPPATRTRTPVRARTSSHASRPRIRSARPATQPRPRRAAAVRLVRPPVRQAAPARRPSPRSRSNHGARLKKHAPWMKKK